jgi:hypothetical protein
MNSLILDLAQVEHSSSEKISPDAENAATNHVRSGSKIVIWAAVAKTDDTARAYCTFLASELKNTSEHITIGRNLIFHWRQYW